MAPSIVIRKVVSAFSHKTKSGIIHAGDHKNVDVHITVPGGSLMSYAFHETSKRNATIHFNSDDTGLHWTGRTETDSGGASGNFEGTVEAVFAKVETPLNDGQLSLFNSFRNRNAGMVDNGDAFNAARLKLASNLIDLDQALGGAAGVTREVNSATPDWHAEADFGPGKYFVVPDPRSRWAISGGEGGPHNNDFHGGGEFNGLTLGIPLNPMRLGGLAAALFVNGSPSDVFQFPPGKNEHVLNVPAPGGDLYFIVGDLNGTYSDNHGVCRVGIFRAE